MAEGKYTIKAEDGDETGRVWDPANGLLVGKAGDEIPLARAVALGLSDPKTPAEPKPAGKVTKTTRTRPKARSGETR